MEALRELGERIREEQDASLVGDERRTRVRQRLALWSAAPERGSRFPQWLHTLRWPVPAALALSALAAGAVYWQLAHSATLTARTADDATPISAGSWVSAATNEVPIDFSDGTRIALAPQSRARVSRLDAHGAQLVLESGKLDVSVVHRAAAEWQLSMGPFAVHVVGTKFGVAWDPERDEFELSLREGQVRVAGCMFGDGRSVMAGETVRASCSTRHFEIASAGGAPSKPPAEPQALVAPAADVDKTEPVVGAVVTGVQHLPKEPRNVDTEPAPAIEQPTAPDWRELARRGDYRAAFAAAEAEGFDALCAQGGTQELTQLGDVARYAGQPARAEKAYLELRRRYPASGAAAIAAFALGRIAFDQRGSYAQAAQWFQTYLTETRGGPLAREAHGRWLESLQRSGNRLAARRVAEQYLKLHPTGPHAPLARELTRSKDSD